MYITGGKTELVSFGASALLACVYFWGYVPAIIGATVLSYLFPSGFKQLVKSIGSGNGVVKK
jgi:hypothetical protein